MLFDNICCKALQNSDSFIPDYTKSHPQKGQSTSSYGLPSVQKNYKYIATTVGQTPVFLPQMILLLVEFLILMAVTKTLATKLHGIAPRSTNLRLPCVYTTSE
jgi:hypothetical protein